MAKNPLSPPETNSSFFSFSITFREIYKAIKFSPAVFFLVITFLFLILQTYIPNFYTRGGYQVLRKQKCRVTQNPLFLPTRPSAQSLAKHPAICRRPLRPPLCPMFLTSFTPKGKATQVPHHRLQLIHDCDPTPLPRCPWDSRANIPCAYSVLPSTLVFIVVKHT